MRIFRHYPFILSLLFVTFFVTDNLFAQVEFIENKGQWDSRVKFMSHAGDGSFFLQEKGFTISQFSSKDVEAIIDKRHGIETKLDGNAKTKNKKLRAHSYSVEFLNALTPQILPDKPISTFNNYFIGNDKSKWASNCRIFMGVTYQNVYPGIDIRYYVDGGKNLKYDFIVHPGADVNNIAMKYSGADKIDVKSRQLVISTPLGKSKELEPYTYQVINNTRQEVECRYVVSGNVVKFKVKNYSPDQTLIIDPTEIFFSYSGSTADNWGFTATYGPDGSFYGGGIVFGTGFPTLNGPSYDQTFNGTFDIGIIKLSPDGRRKIYATYIGGSKEEQPHSLVVDQQGNLILAGRSNSPDYPTTVPVVGNDGKGGDWDIVVTKLNSTGTALIGSMKIGGTSNDGVNIADETGPRGLNSLKRNYGDDARSEVLLDASNNIYVASCTSSTDFPTTAGAFQRKNNGMQDGVVLKLNPDCNGILFSTYLGGSKNDAAYVLALGGNNNIYVAGGTASDDFTGISKAGVVKPFYSTPGNEKSDPCDGFIIELNNTGSAVARGTYIGTGSADQIYGIETDKFGYIYVMGTSEGNMPVINALYFVPGAKQFISKLEPTLNKFDYSTVFGSPPPNSNVPNISPTAFLVDRCQNVYVSGWGGKSNDGFSNGSTKGMPTTPGAIKPQTDASGSDFYFFVMEKNATSQLYGTFFGQEDPPIGVSNPLTFGDHVDGGTSRFDRNGVIYQAMCANCFRTVPFLGTPGAWSQTDQAVGNNGQCNLGMLKIAMNFAGVQASLRASIGGVSNDTVGCVPLRVDFLDTLNKGKLYYWSFGDGAGDTTVSPANSHVYINTGIYRVRLISIDSATCNISDTAYKSIRVGNNKANLDFISQKLQPCTNLSYSFINTSSPTFGSFNPNIFTWDFGDNTAPVMQSQSPPVTHTYAGAGTYQVKLTINDTTFCNSPADTVKTIRLSPQVQALFTTPGRGCVPYNAVFANNSLGGLNFSWDFGDGTSSSEVTPTHLYNNVGTYIVKLRAYDSTSCNKIDSASFTIVVSPIPTAAFTYNPIKPQENTITNFVNNSINATKYLWNFADGDTSTEVNPQHLFDATNTYNVCLKASNDAGCSNDTCINVRALIKPLFDVPSAFTPGRFGVNGRIRVEGFGIAEMKWSIYNRWGQKVYETNNRKSAWDGTFNGKLQPMDVYAYTLEVTFSDGTKVKKTGDITLLR
ncbi:MAG: PKD domain-containing protein [Bacteroidota bacterium]|nr:PKD domain-containing protein [Bacteroidota bacterium]